MFEIGQHVIFVDHPYGTNISLDGRTGMVERLMMSKDNPTELALYGVNWDDKRHESDDQWSVVDPSTLRLFDVKIPELYALSVLYKCYAPYEACNFSAKELIKLAIARDEGRLKEILG